MASPPTPHVAVVAFPFSSHAPKLLAVARALATAAPSATFSFLSTAASLALLRGAAVPANLRFVEVPTGAAADDDDNNTPAWRRMELFLEAAEAGGLRRSLQHAAARDAATAPVSCIVGDAFVSMAADAGVPWVAVWTGGPCALLAHIRSDEIRNGIGDNVASRADELLSTHHGFGHFRVGDLPFGGANPSGDTHRVMSVLLRRVAERVPRAAAAVALNAFPGLFPPDVSAALAAALPNSLPIGPYHLLPGATATSPAAGDPHGCLAWLDRQPERAVVYVSFGTVAALPPDELRELAAGLLEARSGADAPPFLWSLREESWPHLPPGFLDRAAAGEKSGGLVVPWAPQAAVLRHRAVGAFVAHAGWGAVVEGMAGGVPMACRPFFGDQQMNARAVAEMWGIGVSWSSGGALTMTRGGVAALLAGDGEEGATTMRARARELRDKVEEAFRPDGGSMKNFRKFVEIVCTRES